MKKSIFFIFIILLIVVTTINYSTSTTKYQKQIKSCFDNNDTLNSTSDLIEHGETIEHCLQKVGYEIISTFYPQDPDIKNNFDKMIINTNIAYQELLISNECLPNCGSFISYGYYPYVTKFIKNYLNNLLIIAQTKEKHAND